MSAPRARAAAVRILVADDHAIVRRGLRVLLEAEPGWRVSAEAGDGRQALEQAARVKPDVAILDVSMPELDGLEVAERLRRVSPETRILILTMYDAEEVVNRAISRDIDAFVLKSDASRDVVAAVKKCLRGKRYVSPAIAVARRSRVARPRRTLTPRETEVLRLVAEGRSTKEVGVTLGISAKTVDVHRTNLMRKLDIHSVAGLVRYALRARVVAG